MNFTKRVLLLLFMVLALSINVYAKEITINTFKVLDDGESLEVISSDIRSEVDYSDLEVKVIRRVGNEFAVIYTGELGGYEYGIWNKVDFSNMLFLAVAKEETMGQEAFYIVPVENIQLLVNGMNKEKNLYDSSEITSQSESATSNTNGTDLIEYDVTYTITTTDNVTKLNAMFTINSASEEIEPPLLVATIYDNDKVVGMQTARPNLHSGENMCETVSIVIPDDKTDDYYIKLFAWENSDSIEPLGKAKKINDIDSYLREKLIYVTATADTEFMIFMNASTAKGGNNDAIHTIEYDASKVTPIDLCGFTYEQELSTVSITGTDIKIESVDTTNGIIKYRFFNDLGRNTGINNVIKFKALTSITDTEIKYTIQ